jgi:hypothetical protein
MSLNYRGYETPVPVVFPALKAAALLKQAGPVLARWNSLPPEQQEDARRQAREVMAAMASVRASLGDQVADEEEPVSWEEARAEALDPPPFFLLAKRLVELLRREGTLEEIDLADRLSVEGPNETFEDA